MPVVPRSHQPVNKQVNPHPSRAIDTFFALLDIHSGQSGFRTCDISR